MDFFDYALNKKSKTIRVMAVGHRRAVYEELADIVRREQIGDG